MTQTRLGVELEDWLRHTYPNILREYQTLRGLVSFASVMDMDTRTLQVTVLGQPVNLTRNELKLFCLLWEASGEVVSKEDVVNAVWGEHYLERLDDARIAKLVQRLRAKIEPTPQAERFLVSINGFGYRLVRG